MPVEHEENRRMKGGRRLDQWLRILQIVLYLAGVFLWFKDNFAPLRKIALSPAFPLGGLAIVLGLRLAIRIGAGEARFRVRIPREWLVLALLILLVIAIRVPFLLHDYGLVDSDEAISLLQGMHIAEGKTPPIYYYGAQYQGTLSEHFYALLFLAFGYSPLVAKLASVLIFVAFIVVNYFFVKEVFSKGFALVAGLFFALPLVYLLVASFEVASGFSLIFLLTSLILYLAFLIYEKGRDRLLAPLGFTMGLAFWTHPVTIVAILSAGVFLALRFRLRARPYGVLALNFLLGAFPILLAEFFWRFPLLPILASGETTWSVSGAKIARLARLFQTLVSSEPGWMGILALAICGFGIVVLVIRSLREKRFLSSNIFVIYSFIFALAFLLSSWSVTDVIRYLYILFPVIPVLLLSPLRLVRGKLGYALCLLFLGGILTAGNAREMLAYHESVQKADRVYQDTVEAMEGTGVRYWQGDYWRAFLFTALSGERLVVDSITNVRYLPYRLAYYNEGREDSYIFLGPKDSQDDLFSGNLATLLSRLGIPFQQRSVGPAKLFFHIGSPVFPPDLKEDVPAMIPRIEMEEHAFRRGALHLVFRAVDPPDSDKFSLHVEIPGFSETQVRLAPGDGRIWADLPYPRGEPISLRCSLDYQGLRIPSSVSEIPLEAGPNDPSSRDGEIDFLRGIGPAITEEGHELRFCEREVALQVWPSQSGKTRLRLFLDSPFNFSDYLWYGAYAQKVVFRSNGETIAEKRLQDGLNVIDLDLAPYLGQRPLTITFSFSWRLWFKFAGPLRLAAVLHGAELVE
jgi:hypothetical protein